MAAKKKAKSKKRRVSAHRPAVKATKETISLNVLYSQSSTGGEQLSDEPYTSRTDEYHTTTFKGVVVGEMEYDSRWSRQVFEVPKDAFDVPRSHVYVVVGYYQDGDSYGTSYGNRHVVDVYGNPDKAFAVARTLQNEDEETHQSIFGSKYYLPWGGYFARLESVEVEVLPVLRVITDPGDENQDINEIPSW